MTQPEIVTDVGTFVETARAAPSRARISTGIRVTIDDPFEAYRRDRVDRRRAADRHGSPTSTATPLGVQFHPESILTPAGNGLVARFCRACGVDEKQSIGVA